MDVKKFKVNDLRENEYDRFATIDYNNESLIIHFLDGEESYKKYDNCEKMSLNGLLYIGFVIQSGKTDDNIMHIQNVANTPHIFAIVEVVKVIDKYTLLVKTDILDEPMIVDFEVPVQYQVNDRIYVSGSLELEKDSTLEEFLKR